MASGPAPRPPLAQSPTEDAAIRPPRPSDLGTTSWSKALDLYLASYDASGHAEFSGGVSARVAPAAPLSGALPVSEPRAFRVPLALVDDNRGDREIRRRLNERLTRGTRVSERRGWRDAGAHPRTRALGWSRDSATRLDDARLDVSETFGQNARGDAGDRGDRGESPKRRGSWRSDAASTSPRRDPAARSARAAWRRPPPPRRSRSASSGRSSPGRASTSSPSASSTSSSIIASSREEEEEEEEVFAASTRVKAKARADAENQPVSPEARAAARVDALLAGLGVVVFSPDADRRHARAAAEPPRRIAPAPGSAPRAASSARGRRALARDSEIGDSITIGFNTRAARRARRGASSGTSPSSPSSSDSDVGGSDAESSSGSGSGAGSTRSRSSAREAPKHKKPERVGAGDDGNDRNAHRRNAAAALGSRERDAGGPGVGAELGARSGSNPGGWFPRAASFESAAEQAALETSAMRRAAEDLEDVSSATSGSISESGSEGSPAAGDARRARGDFLAEQVRLSLAALEQIRETHSLPASPPESPGAAERAAARAARRARRASGELDAHAGAAAATLFHDALEPAPAAPPASPSGLTGAARVRVMYPELFA